MFKLEEFMGKRVLKSSFLEGFDVEAFFTTRDLPLKYGEREDLIERVENNKTLVAQGLGIPRENLIIPQQTHSDNVGIINNYFSPLTSHLSPYKNTDALITNLPNVALALNFADCVPIILYDSVKKVVAAVHAGWRGTAAKIAAKTIKKMQENYDSSPYDIIALIGPAIGKCCYEVGQEVLDKLLQTVDVSVHGFVYDKMNIDLKAINKFQLLASGVEKIDLCEDCTCCKNELFFSYREENGNTARHSAVIMIKGKK